MNHRKLKSILLGLLSLTTSASWGINLGTGNAGQVLFMPYYNVENGNETLLSVVNNTDRAKAVRINIRESQNSLLVLGFYIYLSSHDTWVAKISPDSGGGAAIVTYDNSCSLLDSGAQTFRSTLFTDGGDTSLARTREGFIEIIEAGVAQVGSNGENAIIDNNCSFIRTAFLTGQLNQQLPMESPEGGLTGSAAIINVGSGTEFEMPVTFLDNAFSQPVHTSAGPDLMDVAPRSNVLVESTSNPPTMSDYWTSGYTAVSAVLISSEISNRYSVNPAVESETDWVITFPTKGYHINSNPGSPEAPFSQSFGGGGACEPSIMRTWDSDGTERNSSSQLCYAANVISFGGSNVLGALRTRITVDTASLSSSNGWASIEFSGQAHSMSSSQGYVFQGLPAIGFAVNRLGNSNVGAVAAYSNVTPHVNNPIKGTQRIHLPAGQERVSTIASFDDDITFISTNRIFTEGALTIGPGKDVTFMAPKVFLNGGFKVTDDGIFRVVSSF